MGSLLLMGTAVVLQRAQAPVTAPGGLGATATCPLPGDRPASRPRPEVCTVLRLARYPDEVHQITPRAVAVGPDNGLFVFLERLGADHQPDSTEVMYASSDGRPTWTANLGDHRQPHGYPSPEMIVLGDQVLVLWARDGGRDDRSTVALVLSSIGRDGAVGASEHLATLESGAAVAMTSSAIALLQAAPSAPVTLQMFDLDGAKRWEQEVDGFVAEADPGDVAFDGEDVIVVTHRSERRETTETNEEAGVRDADLYRYDASGVVEWESPLGGASGFVSLAAGPEQLVVGVNDEPPSSTGTRPPARLQSWTPEGNLRWSKQLSRNGVGTIFVGTHGVTAIEYSSGYHGGSQLISTYSHTGALLEEAVVGNSYLESYGIRAVQDDGRGGLLAIGQRLSVVHSNSQSIYGAEHKQVAVVVHLTAPAGEGGVAALEVILQP